MQVLSKTKQLLQKPHIKAGILVFLIVILAFGIGYTIGRDWNPTPIVIEVNE